MCPYHVPNRLDGDRILHQGIPRYYWTIIGYLPEHELQEIDFLPGCTAFGKRYCFSIVSEATQGVGLSLLSPGGAISEKGSKIAVE